MAPWDPPLDPPLELRLLEATTENGSSETTSGISLMAKRRSQLQMRAPRKRYETQQSALYDCAVN